MSGSTARKAFTNGLVSRDSVGFIVEHPSESDTISRLMVARESRVAARALPVVDAIVETLDFNANEF